MIALSATRWATRTILVLAATAGLAFLGETRTWAQRPAAPQLLPKQTLAYLRVADSRELIKAFSETALGRLGRDEEIRPLVMQLYGSAAQAFTQVQEEIGLSLDELLGIPQGEVCVALVGRESGPPAVILIMDVGSKLPALRTLMEAAQRQATRDGRTARTEDVDGTTLTTFDDEAAFCDREQTFLFSSSADLIKEVLMVWTGGKEDYETLADNLQFTTIMRGSTGSEGERPQVSWFVDPLELFEQATRESGGAQMALAMLPLLGLDGVKAAGGSIIFSTPEFDSVAHMHLLLDSPREGVLNMLAVTAGDVEPENWVPQDAASYTTIHWDAQQTLDELEKLIDQLRGEGAFGGTIQRRLSDPLGVDFQKDILDQLADRLTHVSWFEKPARVNSGTNLIGVRLKDAEAFRGTFDRILARAGSRATQKSYRSVRYYAFEPRRRPQDLDQVLLRQPSPCAAIVGDYLLVSDSTPCLEAAISAKLDPDHAFGDELDYRLIASRIEQQLGSRQAGMVAFQRPEESMRSFYDLATSPTARRRLEELAQTNQALRALHEALRDNPLPPFAAIAKYLAPGGGMLVNDASGFHYTTFSLKRQ